jgi:dUTPase
MIPVVHFRVDFVEDKLYDQDITISARDTGGFGSTGA